MPATSEGRLQSLFEIFLRVETEVRQTTFPRMLLELAVLRAMGLEEVDRIEALLVRLEGLEQRLVGAGGAAGEENTPGGNGNDAAAARPAASSATSSLEAAPWEAYADPLRRTTGSGPRSGVAGEAEREALTDRRRSYSTRPRAVA